MKMMIRGFMKPTSLTTLVAAAGLLMGNVAYAPAHAADLGGGCCSDLEERVAELEATTARKGNRVVSLQVYGQVNKALMIWDDGEDSDAYIVDNDYSSTRLGFTGKGVMKPGVTAGYLIELDIQDSASNEVYNANDPTFRNFASGGDDGEKPGVADSAENEISIRFSEFYLESDRMGRVTLGQGSMATDGINEIVLGNSVRNSDLHHNNAFSIRTSGGAFTGLQWEDVASNLDGVREDRIRYDSPTIYGFIASAAWGDNDLWDAALRYKAEWNSIRFAAGIGYQWDGRGRKTVSTGDETTPTSEIDITSFTAESNEIFSGSASIMHVPTGLYAAIAAGERNVDDSSADDSSFYYVQLGLERKFLPYGTTTIYGEYAEYTDFGAVSGGFFSDREGDAERWGLGIVQRFDSAALELYAQATFWSYDSSTSVAVLDPDGFTDTTSLVDYEDFGQVLIGSRIKF